MHWYLSQPNPIYSLKSQSLYCFGVLTKKCFEPVRQSHVFHQLQEDKHQNIQLHEQNALRNKIQYLLLP